MPNYFSTSTIKRLQKEIREIANDNNPWYTACPLEDDIFEWHFTFRGAPDSEFEGGVYHGRILFPHDFPNSPPDIVFLTPNGRFETGVKICLSITHYHSETWQPCFSVRTIILALSAFMTTPSLGAVGSVDWPKPERIRAAKKSVAFKCEKCGTYNLTALPPIDSKLPYKDFVHANDTLRIEFSHSKTNDDDQSHLSHSENSNVYTKKNNCNSKEKVKYQTDKDSWSGTECEDDHDGHSIPTKETLPAEKDAQSDGHGAGIVHDDMCNSERPVPSGDKNVGSDATLEDRWSSANGNDPSSQMWLNTELIKALIVKFDVALSILVTVILILLVQKLIDAFIV